MHRVFLLMGCYMDKGLIKDKNLQQRVVDSLEKIWDLTDELVDFYPPYDRYTVAVFGSARLKPESPHYQEVVAFGRELSALECNVVTGGGPGIMEAANMGAKEGSSNSVTKSIGINIELPYEQTKNPFIDESFLHKTFFTRLQHFTAISDCFVAFYGGIGTVLEILTVLQLMQVKKIDNRKLILVGDMWPGLINWFESEMLKDDMHMIHRGDLLIPHLVNDYHDALEIIKEHKKIILHEVTE